MISTAPVALTISILFIEARLSVWQAECQTSKESFMLTNVENSLFLFPLWKKHIRRVTNSVISFYPFL